MTLWQSSRDLFWILAFLLIPVVLLIPLGVLWLWSQGWLLIWVLVSLSCTVLGYGMLWWRQSRRAVAPDTGGQPETLEPSPPDRSWSPRDQEAWEEVLAEAGLVEKEVVLDREHLFALAQRTIERVARHYHPEDADPVWSFTGPELLMLTERVSQRLRRILLEHVPAAHRIEARHLWRVWELKPMAETGLKTFRHLHNAWRLTRTINPVAALLAEARQYLVSRALDETGNYLRTQGARIWVEEVGRAAIDLYSGRLRVDLEWLEKTAQQERERIDIPGPLRLLVAGRVNAGKSSLINQLLGEPVAGVARSRLTTRATHYPLHHPDLPETILIDSPGLEEEGELSAWLSMASDSDGLIWVTSLDFSDWHLDRWVLRALREHFLADARRSPLPVLIIASRADLNPGGEILEAMRVRMAEELPVDLLSIVPLSLGEPLEPARLEALWGPLGALCAAARYTRGQRLQIAAASSAGEQYPLWSQGRSLVTALYRKARNLQRSPH